MLTSRKPVAALRGTQLFVEHGLAARRSCQEETVIFEGTAEEAARAFPTTSNVAASLRLAVDPRRARAGARRRRARRQQKRPRNPRRGRIRKTLGECRKRPLEIQSATSQFAAFSAIATLKNLTRSLRVGT